MSCSRDKNWRSRQEQEQEEKHWSLQAGKSAVLRAAADESARRVRALYFSFLLFAFYVAVIVFSTTDEQLLKETGTHVPLFNVKLPLLEFYRFVPWLVLIFHVHLLSQFYLLSRKLFDLDQALRLLPSELEQIQRNLPFPLIFSHVIIGTQHPGLIRWAFRMAVFVTILVAPILLLAAIQYKFLPYHSEWITLNHQVVLSLDLLLLWIFWPRLFSRSNRWRVWWPWSWCWHVFGGVLYFVRPRHWRRRWHMWGILGSTFLLLIGSWILLIPPHSGIERLAGHGRVASWIHRNLVLRERTLMRKEPPIELLSAAREKDTEAEARVWLKDSEALDLRERDLRYADFSASRLWDADLQQAQLQYANLSWAQLQDVDLGLAQLQGANFWEAQLQGANLWEAQLQGAGLSLAQLQGANLSGARPQGADLFGARLQGADLRKAWLQGASLRGAQLQGADLREAQLQGADLREAQLQGADLREAQLQGADLREAQLQGADLRGALLQGANLERAQLQIADFQGAQLQGANFGETQLQGASLRWAAVYGTDFRGAELSFTDLRGLRLLPVGWKCPSEPETLLCELECELDLSLFSGIKWLEASLEQGGEHWTQDGRERVEETIERFWSIAFDLSLDGQPLEPTAISPPQKSDVMHDQEGLLVDWPAPPGKAELAQARADYLAMLACTDQYIAKRMLQRAEREKFGEDNPALEQALRAKADSGDCPVLERVLKENQ